MKVSDLIRELEKIPPDSDLLVRSLMPQAFAWAVCVPVSSGADLHDHVEAYQP